MAENGWSSAKVILGVIGAVATGTATAGYFVEVRPLQRDLAQALNQAAACREALDLASNGRGEQLTAMGEQLTQAKGRAELAERQLSESKGKLQECLSRPGSAIPDDDRLKTCQQDVSRLKQQLSDSDGGKAEIQGRLDECWNRCKQVTPRNFSLRKGRREVVSYKGSEYGITFVDWVERDSKDVTILIDKQGEPPVTFRARDGRQTPFHVAGLGFVAELFNAERVNDRVGLRVEEAD